MAFRATAQKLKSFAPTADRSLNPAPDFKARLKRGDFVPVGIVLGMVATASDGGSMGPGGSLGPATSLGVYTALHQLHSAPNVHVKKLRRETMPEVVEPEHVAAEADKFVKKSFFRNVAHLKDTSHAQVVPNPIVGDIRSRPLPVETLKDIGVEPKP